MVPRQQQEPFTDDSIITGDSSVENTLVFENSRSVSSVKLVKFLYHEAAKTIQEHLQFYKVKDKLVCRIK